MAKAARPPTVKRKPQAPGPQTRLVKPKSKRARRILEAREPKLVEDPKKVLLLYGNKTSQVVKDVLADIGKLKAIDAIKYTRKNAEVRPFEAGGEGALEHFSRKTDAATFALGSSSKKRPHNLVLGRFFDHRLLDMVELGVDRFRSLRDFKAAAATVQVGNKPAFVFAGEQFDSDPQLRLCKSILLDLFRGRIVENINLKGLDHVIFVTALEAKLLLRQYRIALKKSGTRIPRVELQEMGPSLDLSLRRVREAPPDLMAEALKQPKMTAKKEKNVSTSMLDGKVGRIYMPRQDFEGLALRKMKGLKRERQAVAQGGDGDAAPSVAADDDGGVDMTDI